MSFVAIKAPQGRDAFIEAFRNAAVRQSKTPPNGGLDALLSYAGIDRCDVFPLGDERSVVVLGESTDTASLRTLLGNVHDVRVVILDRAPTSRIAADLAAGLPSLEAVARWRSAASDELALMRSFRSRVTFVDVSACTTQPDEFLSIVGLPADTDLQPFKPGDTDAIAAWVANRLIGDDAELAALAGQIEASTWLAPSDAAAASQVVATAWDRSQRLLAEAKAAAASLEVRVNELQAERHDNRRLLEAQSRRLAILEADLAASSTTAAAAAVATATTNELKASLDRVGNANHELERELAKGRYNLSVLEHECSDLREKLETRKVRGVGVRFSGGDGATVPSQNPSRTPSLRTGLSEYVGLISPDVGPRSGAASALTTNTTGY